MLAKKNSIRSAIIFLALAVLVGGCTPAGPRAFLKGKKYLDRGDFSNAAAQFKVATTALATNAQVWNYYGVALQGSGQPQAAAAAYQRSLELDRDLVEAHFNLGNLWLEQNQPDAAKTEFTAYTLRRNNDAAGWLKLGSAQLRLSETAAAEKSFSTVLYLKPNDPDAYNGLGLARIQRGMPRDAAKFFSAAIQTRPNFAGAILNLATINQEYLHDNNAALQNYRSYLALNPRPANWDDVNALANRLETQPQAPLPPSIAAATTETVPVAKVNPPAPQPKPVATVSRPPAVSQSDVAAKTPTRNSQPPVRSAPVQTQVVQVQPAPEIVTSPRATENQTSKPMAKPPTTDDDSYEVPMPAEQKTGFWHRLFGSSKKESQPDSQYIDNGVTPLPAPGSGTAQETAKPVETKKLSDVSPAPTAVSLGSFPRYHYLSPRKPDPGNHANGSVAAGSFTKAQLYEQDEKWSDAMQWYRQAAEADPSWFEAQYNTAVLAHRLRAYALALKYYENALAIQPDSLDARYNFALALKAAGYAPDAVNELQKILAANPNEARAHLALGNIYAQTLHNATAARPHYLKMLELEPDSPQASDIRFWLAANPN